MSRTRVPLAGLAAAGLLLLGAGPAAAHVGLTASTTAAGATAEVRLEVPHGCAGSATTDLAVRMPEGVGELVAADTERWSAAVGADGVTFHTDAPLPDGMRDEVAFSVRLPDQAGAELVFPVVQRCVVGESAWTEVAEDEASREALDMPAPVLVVTGGSSADAAADSGAMAVDPDGRLLTYGAAGVLAVGCLASGAVLVLRRRRA